jgi:thiamine-phosphate pyrophosphorylase
VIARRAIDLSVYLLVDPDALDVEMLLEEAIHGGVTAVQLRQKSASTRRMIDDARRLRAWLAPYGIPLIVNDRVDVALAAGADGVHVGQDDMSPEDARRLVGRDMIVGLSLWDMSQATSVDRAIVDYVGIGPVYPTTGKLDAVAPVGLDGLAAIRARVDVPAVAIGGIDATNAAAVIQAGADGVAVITAICQARDPRAAARALADAVHAGRRAGASR